MQDRRKGRPASAGKPCARPSRISTVPATLSEPKIWSLNFEPRTWFTPLKVSTPTPAVSPGAVIRPLRASDEAQWRGLWQGYLTFYETALPDEVTAATFARLLSDDPDEMRGRVAEVEGRLVGMVHYVRHRHCWRDEKVTYLQDLFALPETRGTGLGRALIEEVYREADAGGTPMVYWLTAGSNVTARQLYDRIGVLTPFIEYDRPE